MNTVEAIYERGVFRMEGPIDLAEGTRVSLVVSPAEPAVHSIGNAAKSRALVRRFVEIASQETTPSGTTDDAVNHDAILYGQG